MVDLMTHCVIMKLSKGDNMKNQKYLGTWIKQLREVHEDIERLKNGTYSWFEPHFYYNSKNEKDILIEALKLEKRLIKEIDAVL